MPKCAVIEKRVGETPLQALEAFRSAKPELAGVPMTYAGRLDPMASGKLIILMGEECKNKKAYTRLDKEYQFEVLLGLKTDTGDVLGIASTCAAPADVSITQIKQVARSFKGRHTFTYPQYSSKTVGGKPLFQYAHEQTEVELPRTDVQIYALRFLDLKIVPKADLFRSIENNITAFEPDTSSGRIGSDFRKERIVGKWKELGSGAAEQYALVRFKAIVSSGTYIRTLAEKITEALGTCGLAYSIHRTKIGKYHRLFRVIPFLRTF
jgi:tRNA pseudouridine55 synthase